MKEEPHCLALKRAIENPFPYGNKKVNWLSWMKVKKKYAIFAK